MLDLREILLPMLGICVRYCGRCLEMFEIKLMGWGEIDIRHPPHFGLRVYDYLLMCQLCVTVGERALWSLY